MSNKLKITFEHGGVIYADLLCEAAPKTVGLVKKLLPRAAKMKHISDAGPALYFDHDLGDVEPENIVCDKVYGQVTVNFGSPVVPGCFIRIYYNNGKEIRAKNEENLFAVLDKDSMNFISSISYGIWTQAPEYATIELC